MFLKVHTDNPSPKHLQIILESLKEGGLIIYPTDTVYGIGCDMNNNKAVERLCKVIGKKPEKAKLSLICSNLSHISEFTLPFETRIYKLMKKSLPGPYTFILNASNKVPKIFKNNRKTIGIRVPDSNLVREMVEEFGNPIVTASIKENDDFIEYPTNPQQIYDLFKDKVDLVINGGPGGNIPSTVFDCTGDEIIVIREGKGDIDIL
jgi:tRNA threonylcarbamoyl adenosine modification protein (Sua5/YciO/YrdC/YwlC family)